MLQYPAWYHTWYQQDGASPHNHRDVKAYLNVRFPNRWIGNNSDTLGPATGNDGRPIRWPARSPDMTPLDFFYWPYVKNRLYNGRAYANLEELQAQIIEISNSITREMLENVMQSFYNRLWRCTIVNGGHFEHLRHANIADII